VEWDEGTVLDRFGDNTNWRETVLDWYGDNTNQRETPTRGKHLPEGKLTGMVKTPTGG